MLLRLLGLGRLIQLWQMRQAEGRFTKPVFPKYHYVYTFWPAYVVPYSLFVVQIVRVLSPRENFKTHTAPLLVQVNQTRP